MTINWEEKRIDDAQHALQPEQQSPLVKDIRVGDVAYISSDSIAADTDGGLWLDPLANAYNEDEAVLLSSGESVMDLCRVIHTHEGYVVDASAGSYTLEDGSETKVVTDSSLDKEGDGWTPVIGLTATDDERNILDEILFYQHNILLGRSVLLADVELDEYPRPEDDGSAS